MSLQNVIERFRNVVCHWFLRKVDCRKVARISTQNSCRQMFIIILLKRHCPCGTHSVVFWQLKYCASRRGTSCDSLGQSCFTQSIRVLQGVSSRPYGLTALWRVDWQSVNSSHGQHVTQKACDELTLLCLPISRGKISCRLPSVVPGVIVTKCLYTTVWPYTRPKIIKHATLLFFFFLLCHHKT